MDRVSALERRSVSNAVDVTKKLRDFTGSLGDKVKDLQEQVHSLAERQKIDSLAAAQLHGAFALPRGPLTLKVRVEQTIKTN